MIQDFGRELAVGGFRGYRWWRTALGGWLQSPWYGRGTWDPHRNEAVCLVTTRPRRWMRRQPPLDHARGLPVAGCDCGFYALHEPPGDASRLEQQVFPWQTNPHLSGVGELVFGVVEAWGRVLIGTHGWRAQFCRPIALYIPTTARLPIQEQEALMGRYAMPVTRELAALTGEFGPTENPAAEHLRRDQAS